MKIIAVSDVHLGSEDSNKSEFDTFLNSLIDDQEVTDLVLLGDIVEMWRRDASGVFLENMDTVQIIKDLQRKIKVHCVAGNHDYHLLKMKNRAPYYNYPFEFNENLELQDGDRTYRFMHGYEFEYGNELALMEPIMELLCHIMTDAEGVSEDKLWVYLARKITDLQYTILTHTINKEDLNKRVRKLSDSPKVRLKDKLLDIERRAYAEVQDNAVLVFGHTHHPFINDEENLVNTGSWVNDSIPHNTYLEILDGVPRLFVYGGKEIKERQKTEKVAPSPEIH